jgi:hypothetical protein
MSNPNDPWSARPQNEPTEAIGQPVEQQGYHTQDPYQAYGYVPPNATQGYPTYETFDPNKPPPNPTQAYPTYQGQQWNGYPGEIPPLDQQPGGVPPRRNIGLWIAIGACVLLLIAVVGAGFLIFGSKNDSSSTASGTNATTVRPIPSGPKTSGQAQPPLSLPSGIPGIPGLGNDSGGAAIGSISANDGATLTINELTGGSVTVHTNSDTQVVSLTGDKISDLKVGEAVVVQGDKQGDGSIMAKVIVSTSLPNFGGGGN